MTTHHTIPAHCEACKHWRVPSATAFDGWGFCTLAANVRRQPMRTHLPVHKSGYCTSHTPCPEQVRT